VFNIITLPNTSTAANFMNAGIPAVGGNITNNSDINFINCNIINNGLITNNSTITVKGVSTGNYNNTSFTNNGTLKTIQNNTNPMLTFENNTVINNNGSICGPSTMATTVKFTGNPINPSCGPIINLDGKTLYPNDFQYDIDTNTYNY